MSLRKTCSRESLWPLPLCTHPEKVTSMFLQMACWLDACVGVVYLLHEVSRLTAGVSKEKQCWEHFTLL
eukprot:2817428-Amphidinium_carterae.2